MQGNTKLAKTTIVIVDKNYKMILNTTKVYFYIQLKLTQNNKITLINTTFFKTLFNITCRVIQNWRITFKTTIVTVDKDYKMILNTTKLDFYIKLKLTQNNTK